MARMRVIPGKEFLPNTQHDLEALGLGSRDDVLRGIAVAGGVGAHKRGVRLQRIKVLLVVLGRLAVGALRAVLVAQSETKGTALSNRGGGRHQERKQSGETHYGGISWRERIKTAEAEMGE